jgi:anthranilate phosphoribosyltransferase
METILAWPKLRSHECERGTQECVRHNAWYTRLQSFSMLSYLHRVVARENLSVEEARDAMLAVLGGDATTSQIAAFLVALRMKGETADEVLGFALAMREKSARVEPLVDSEPLLDTCGTGGDGGGTFNISTIAAFVAAGAGVRVAKHGNRSLSGLCGSADLLEELGIRLLTSGDEVARAIREVGIGFMFAPAFHPAMKHAQPARAELKMRTVFNLLGPLANPAGATHQLIGAPSAEAAELMANALGRLGCERAFVVHGSDGLDEVTTTGPTAVFEVTTGGVQRFSWRPGDFSVEQARMSDLAGGDRALNRQIAIAVLEGEHGARRDIVLVNAAAALVAAGVAEDLGAAMRRAAESVDSGAARKKVDELANFSGR